MSLGQNCAVSHGVVIASGQAMFKPGLDGFSYRVGPVFGGEGHQFGLDADQANDLGE
jgi:hypothetical protein